MKKNYSLNKKDSKKMKYIDSEIKELKENGRLINTICLSPIMMGAACVGISTQFEAVLSNILNVFAGAAILMGTGGFITIYNSKKDKYRRKKIKELKELKNELIKKSIDNENSHTYYKKR